MFTVLMLLMVTAMLALASLPLVHASSPRRRRIALANLLTAGWWPDGHRTYTSEAAIVRFQLLKTGTNPATQVSPCGAAEQPLGFTQDEASGAGQEISVRILGSFEGTAIGLSDAPITNRVRLVPGTTAGRVRALPNTGGTYWVVGTALSAASGSGQQVEIAPNAPYPVVVP